MSVKQRMYLLMLSAIIGLIALAGMSIYQIDRVFTAANFATVNVVPSLVSLDEASVAFAAGRTKIWQYASSSDAAVRTQLGAEMKEEHTKFNEQMNLYEKELIADDKDKAMLQEDRVAEEAFQALCSKAMGLANDGKPDEARDLLVANLAVGQRVIAALKTHTQYNVGIAKQSESDANSILGRARIQAILVAVIVISGVGVMGLKITQTLISSLLEAVSISRSVAGGDLTRQIVVNTTDEFGQLLQALKDMNDGLVGIVSQVRVSTDTIDTASAEIASGNLELSSRTESQASSLEETAASMEELTSTVKHNSENAQMANKLAQTASDVAVRGGAEVTKVVETMGTINDSAKKIVDIISVIDGIAFQTNILALNAAVEAARAGEQGRGFAVVASEVRNLAQRSAAAAKEIKELIGASVENVEAGSKLVNLAGITMTEVVNSIRQVTDVMAEITAASHEQSQGINQVNQAVIDMDSVTQQNAALVEEAAAAAGSLQEQAAHLSELVKVFKLNATNGQARSAPTRPTNQPVKKLVSPRKISGQQSVAKPIEHKPNPADDSADGFEEF